MGLGKTAATLAVHLIHPPKTPREGVPLDETEWGPISGTQVLAQARFRGITVTIVTHVQRQTHFVGFCVDVRR